MIKRNVFHLYCIIIAVVSAIDIYWLSRNRSSITMYEMNPIGQYLLKLDNGDVSLFILVKILGTNLVIAILYTLKYFNIKYTYIIAASLTLIQILLLLYLVTPYYKYLEIFYP